MNDDPAPLSARRVCNHPLQRRIVVAMARAAATAFEDVRVQRSETPPRVTTDSIDVAACGECGGWWTSETTDARTDARISIVVEDAVRHARRKWSAR